MWAFPFKFKVTVNKVGSSGFLYFNWVCYFFFPATFSSTVQELTGDFLEVRASYDVGTAVRIRAQSHDFRYSRYSPERL